MTVNLPPVYEPEKVEDRIYQFCWKMTILKLPGRRNLRL